MSMLKKSWSEVSAAPISEQAVRALHVPSERFKFYLNSYQSGMHFPTRAGHAFVLYVLAGSCKTAVGGNEVNLAAGEFATFEKGAYEFDATGGDELKLMKVFSLS